MRQRLNKWFRAYFVIIMIQALSACQIEFPDLHSGPVKVGLYVGGSETRTEMLSNGLSAVWTAGDELAVWASNTSGSFALSNQVFKTYGIDGQRGFFTSTLAEPMPEGTYTYYCTYPVPVSVAGTEVTFNLPAQQDGKVTGGADIMIATPVSHGPLVSVPEPEDHSGMRMTMNRMVHQFRFYMQEESDGLNEDIKEIIVTMPDPVVGTVSADITSPTDGLTLTGGSDVFSLNLSDGLPASPSAADMYFACGAICPSDKVYTDSDFMNITLYSQKYKAVLDPISLAGRQFLAGHSTPVRMTLNVFDEYYRLSMKVGDNHIGEPLSNVSISFDGVQWYAFNPTGADVNGNFTHVVEALNDEGKAAYDLIISSIESGKATYIYETEHALVNRPLTADMMTYDGNRIVLDLGDVPYLLEEDFSTANSYAVADAYTASADQDSNKDGYLLNGYLSADGWNAARFGIMEGDCIRINCRYESGGFVVGRYCGRLDTPALKYLKDGASVTIVVEYDKASYVPPGYKLLSSFDDSKNKKARYKIGVHTASEDTAIDGVNSNNINSNSTIVYTSDLFASEDITNLSHMTLDIQGVGSTSRIVFYADTDRDTSYAGANSVYYLYLDNIKVYIKSN